MTQEAAKAAAEKLLSGARKAMSPAAAPAYPTIHARGWGTPKEGKSHFGLGARSHEVWLTERVEKGPFEFEVKDIELLIPSKALTVAYANFDRDATTVLQNLPPDSYFIEESLYLDPATGEPYIAPGLVEREAQLRRLVQFMSDVDEAWETVDLFQLDGGTIAWENVRELRLPPPAGKDADGSPHHLPRQYAPANNSMRAEVMQRLYGMKMHTYLTTEAGQQWDSASKPVDDPNEKGGARLRPDSWNKTDHYVDASFQLRHRERAATGSAAGGLVNQHELMFTECIRPTLIGTHIANPTFGKLYKAIFPAVPLLKREDRATFEQLKEKHGDKLVWK